MNSVSVADMIRALSELPPDARLVVTQGGYYADGELANIFLPESYTVESGRNAGTVVYCIGHSYQNY